MNPILKPNLRSILIALLLPAAVLFALGVSSGIPTLAGCKKDCGGCQWLDDQGQDQGCRKCTDLFLGSANNGYGFEKHPECCGCEASDLAKERFGIENWVCDIGTSGDNPYEGTSTGVGEGSSGVEPPTSGDPPNPCPGTAHYQCRGYVLGTYVYKGEKRWKISGTEHIKCFDWEMTLDAGEEELEVCAADMDLSDARNKCVTECEERDWQFPATSGVWTWAGNYCQVEVDAPGGVVPGDCNCAGTGGGTVTCDNIDPPSEQILKVGDCDGEGGNPDCPENICTGWDPGFSIGYTSDESDPYADHKIYVDDDFWAGIKSNSSPLAHCDGTWVDLSPSGMWVYGVSAGSFFDEIGVESGDGPLRLATSYGSFGTRIDASTWIELWAEYRELNHFYFWYKRSGSWHHAEITVIDCGVNACPNP